MRARTRKSGAWVHNGVGPPLFVAVMLLMVPSAGAGQSVEAFEQLGLLVNLGDRIQLQDQSGIAHAGRITQLTRDDIAIETAAGLKYFTADSTRTVAVEGHPMRRSALIGAATFAVMGAVVRCSRSGGWDCALVGSIGAAPIGAGAGLAIGTLIARFKTVYVAREHPTTPATHVAIVPGIGLLEDLGRYVNLNDRVSVEDQSGVWKTGRLTELSFDELTLQTDAGDKHFSRGDLQTVAIRRQQLRTGTMIGAAAGAVYGVASECRGGANADCPDGVIIGTALGAAGGALVGALWTKTTVVYTARRAHTYLSPTISRGTTGITITQSW